MILFSVGVISRVIAHLPNFTPVGAIIVYSASRMGIKKALALGALTMLVSDAILGFSYVSIFVYLGFASYAVISKLFSKKIGLMLSAILGSCAFFLISNFGVFLGPWYDHSLSGLLTCYTLAIPFFSNMLIADIVFIGAISIIENVVSYKFKKINWEVLWLQLFPKAILRKR